MTPEMVLELMNRTLDGAVVFRQCRPGNYAVTFPYDPSIVAAIKCIPSAHRGYLPAEKKWLVCFEYAQPLMEVLRDRGYRVEVVEA